MLTSGGDCGTMNSEPSLVSYCGLYCDACAIRQGLIRNRGMQLLEVLSAYLFRDVAKEAKEWAPELAYYSSSKTCCKL